MRSTSLLSPLSRAQALLPLALLLACPGEAPEADLAAAAPSPLRRLSDWEGDENAPRFTADGRDLLFHSDRDGDFEVYRLTLDSGAIEQLTFNPARDRYPDASPDGREVVFSSNRSGRTALWIRPLDGGDPRLLAEREGVSYVAADWSPDGEWIAASGIGPEGGHLWRVSRDGQQLRQVTQGGDEYWPRWSVDGRSLLYHVGSTDEILEVDVATGVRRSISRGEFVGWRPLWGPAGRRITFVGQPDRWRIFQMELEGRSLSQLTTGGDDDFPDLSPDGRRLVFSSQRAPARLRVVTAEGKPTGSAIAADPVAARFAPDGSQVLLSEGADGLALQRAAGGARTELPLAQPILALAPWTSTFELSPSGEWLAYASNGGLPIHGADIYRAPAAGGKAERLTDLGDAESAVWCDEETLLFSSSGGDRSATRQVWRLDLGANAYPMTDSPGGKWPTDCRNDGDLLVYTRIHSREVVVAERRDGSWSEEVVAAGVEGVLSPDGKRLAFISLDATRRRDLMVREPDGTLSRLTETPAAESSPSWAPDGSRILFLSRETGRDLWLLELGT